MKARRLPDERSVFDPLTVDMQTDRWRKKLRVFKMSRIYFFLKSVIKKLQKHVGN